MKFTPAVAILFLSCAISNATTTVPMSLEVFSGPLTGETASGTITFDETLLTGAALEAFGVLDGLEIELNFMGQTFTEADDNQFDLYPVVEFSFGEISYLDFLVVDGDGVGMDLGNPLVAAIQTGFLFPDGNGGYEGELFAFAVPEPATLSLLALAAACVGNRRRS